MARFDEDQVLIVPAGDKSCEAARFDMTKLHEVESRIGEVAGANPATLPTLVMEFTLGLSEVGRIISVVDYELREAKRKLDVAKSIATLDKVEEILRIKNIKSTADSREAVVILDFDVQDGLQRVNMLSAIASLLDGKRNAIEAAYHGCKKICDLNMKMPRQGAYGEN